MVEHLYKTLDRLGDELHGFRLEMRGELGELRREMRGELREMRGEMSSLRREMLAAALGTSGVMAAAIITVIVKVL